MCLPNGIHNRNFEKVEAHVSQLKRKKIVLKQDEDTRSGCLDFPDMVLLVSEMNWEFAPKRLKGGS